MMLSINDFYPRRKTGRDARAANERRRDGRRLAEPLARRGGAGAAVSVRRDELDRRRRPAPAHVRDELEPLGGHRGDQVLDWSPLHVATRPPDDEHDLLPSELEESMLARRR